MYLFNDDKSKIEIRTIEDHFTLDGKQILEFAVMSDDYPELPENFNDIILLSFEEGLYDPDLTWYRQGTWNISGEAFTTPSIVIQCEEEDQNDNMLFIRLYNPKGVSWPIYFRITFLVRV